MTLRLKISFDKFRTLIEQKTREGKILHGEIVKDENEYEDFKARSKKWENEVINMLKTSFSLDDNYLVQEFYQTYSSIFNIAGTVMPLKQKIDNQKMVVNMKIQYLIYNMEIMKVSDAIVRPDEIDLEKRAKLKLAEKLSLILDKLYLLNHDSVYPIKELLEGNGVPLRKMNEDWEIGKMLEDRGLVTTQNGLGMPCAVSLTGEGVLLIERNIEAKKNKQKKNMEEGVIKIFISHGGSPLWRDVERFIDKKLRFETAILKDANNRGRTIIEKLEQETEDCDYAIIVMTAEDLQENGGIRARQNVIHEIGYCQGAFGRENVLVLKQNGVEEFSNISGIVYEAFTGDNISATFERIRQELEDLEERLED
jgi:hypothetical protein